MIFDQAFSRFTNNGLNSEMVYGVTMAICGLIVLSFPIVRNYPSYILVLYQENKHIIITKM